MAILIAPRQAAGSRQRAATQGRSRAAPHAHVARPRCASARPLAPEQQATAAARDAKDFGGGYCAGAAGRTRSWAFSPAEQGRVHCALRFSYVRGAPGRLWPEFQVLDGAVLLQLSKARHMMARAPAARERRATRERERAPPFDGGTRALPAEIGRVWRANGGPLTQ